MLKTFAVFLCKSSGKNLVLEIVLVLSANQTAGFLNELFLLRKLMKQSHF